jgi:hypothetical protein
LHFLFFLLALFLSQTSSIVYSAADHVVISEVQIDGVNSQDEFVELYNPTYLSVDLFGWRLIRKTAGGTKYNLVSSLSGSIEPYGYFLIAHPNYDGAVSADLPYSVVSGGIAVDNTVILYSDTEVTEVDKVRMEDASVFETATTENPTTDGSIERKAFATSTSVSMDPGVVDETFGNGEDSDNNSADFVQRDLSDSQNTSSDTESPTIPHRPVLHQVHHLLQLRNPQ